MGGGVFTGFVNLYCVFSRRSTKNTSFKVWPFSSSKAVFCDHVFIGYYTIPHKTAHEKDKTKLHYIIRHLMSKNFYVKGLFILVWSHKLMLDNMQKK